MFPILVCGFMFNPVLSCSQQYDGGLGPDKPVIKSMSVELRNGIKFLGKLWTVDIAGKVYCLINKISLMLPHQQWTYWQTRQTVTTFLIKLRRLESQDWKVTECLSVDDWYWHRRVISFWNGYSSVIRMVFLWIRLLVTVAIQTKNGDWWTRLFLNFLSSILHMDLRENPG